MAYTAPKMTPTQIKEAGFSIFKLADIGNAKHAAYPWVIIGLDGTPRAGQRVLTRYAGYNEAVADLHEALTDPDGALADVS